MQAAHKARLALVVGLAGGYNLPPPWGLLSRRKFLNINRFHLDHAGVTRPRIEEGLHNHRARREFGEVGTLEVLGDRVVQVPQRRAVELGMARSLELLNDGEQVASGKRLAFSELYRKGARIVKSDLGLLVAVDPRFHVRPMREQTSDCFAQDAGNVAQDVRRVTAGELDV